MTELFISNDGEHWGYEEETHAQNDALGAEAMEADEAAAQGQYEAEQYGAEEAAIAEAEAEASAQAEATAAGTEAGF